nr:hypothetical protein [Acidobacteriota bacterium]
MRRHGDASPARLALALVMVSLAIGCARSVRLEPADARMACRAGRVDDRTIGPEVEWWQPAGRAQRQRLDAWCATVGPAVIQRPAEHAALATTVPVVDRLVVLTWNMHVGDGDLRRLVRDLRAGTLTGGRVPDGVVLLLQEARRVGAEVPAVLAAGAPVPR